MKKVGEKVNKAGGLQAIGYGARAGKPYVRGRPDDVVANEYRKSPYGPIRGNDKKVAKGVGWLQVCRFGGFCTFSWGGEVSHGHIGVRYRSGENSA